ncbi:CDP-2,3-bis-(O-geranylgeranyl)-sn-glycerol synthase [Acidianus sulfidivorans JP7]|uniref:CDP-archaeol synthase n=1 Tax=Acidianus sulfidivorans JP7 TaxID=619593 RepID=A0A2U9IM07_9CREN|nr:CDP-2,3-bis-(O-geranylgeranyl)-sn-glycerol synthase [Acidianus sulfidivorans]AWR97047.1 CDP-2,3-bis-(O-geranylgeranyl)-sn-glycerol synthase [Acidianus sulfidivorans JP7]
MLKELLLTIIIYLPAFVANGSAPFVKKGHPIDFYKNFRDKRRIFGDGKTFEGLIIALSFGTTVGVILARFLGYDWILISFIESLMAMIGDIIGAFIKRRLNIPRGGRAIGLDQIDFVLGSTLALLLLGIKISLIQFVFIIIVAFGLHILTNNVAYRLKIKSVPW